MSIDLSPARLRELATECRNAAIKVDHEYGGMDDRPEDVGCWEAAIALDAIADRDEAAAGYVLVPKEPTPVMIEEGAKRLVSFEDGAVWPDSWDPLQVMQARLLAERCLRSGIAAAQEAP